MKGLPERLLKQFVRDYFRFATPEDVPATSAGRTALALSQLQWASQRKPGEIMVRAFNPDDSTTGFGTGHTIVETIADDSPFIISSLTMRLNSLSQGVLVKLHSMFNVERDDAGRLRKCSPIRPETKAGREQAGHAESWTHFQIPRLPDPNELRALERHLTASLRDVRRAVGDWPKMLQLMTAAADDLARFGSEAASEEACEFLRWLADDHFTLLGVCRLPRPGKAGKPSGALGLLRDAARRKALRRVPAVEIATPGQLTITKAPIRSTVHRPALLDDIRVPAFDGSGRSAGEYRFVGLFTSIAYHENPADIPLLGRKVDRVMAKSKLVPTGHRGKMLRHILDTLPRDVLIQLDESELERIGTGILNLEERRKIRLFCSRSPYGDFLYCLVYVPRDGYSPAARTRIESLLVAALQGDLVGSELTISESTLARISLTIQRHDPNADLPDIAALQTRLIEVAASWLDRSRFALLEALGDHRALDLHHRLAQLFPVEYRETIPTERLSDDFEAIARILDGGHEQQFRLAAADTAGVFTLFQNGPAIPLYVTSPILENMGVKLVQERSFRLDDDSREIWIQDFSVESLHGESLAGEELAARFETCFARTLGREAENDIFNHLVVACGLDWRQIVVLRAYCKYLLQCGAQFSQSYMLDTLRRHPGIVRALIARFGFFFDPDLSSESRRKGDRAQKAKIERELEQTTSLDEDRILRMFAGALEATLRTNFYQHADGVSKPWLSIKLDPAGIPELPEPRPRFEIFVYSPDVEGIHLRCGEIARGGLRWSDRREDFRTEVLGLMKAQQVKNTVIVPAGAKGGFVLKNPPSGNDAALREHVATCYRNFLRGMLDLTDNVAGTRTIGPDSTVCRDKPDAYLVVAADKGTATFSDTANAVAAEYDFWLGDAFASGGSAGYDHKKMGITARGAWESVKRHFREMGLDTQAEPFTVVGIGDMAGDVFGNGMLLSRHIRLVAAFNHRQIFIDPDPDAAKSHAERKRLFAMPGSGWGDYDAALISEGGGVFDRSSKSIELSPQARAALGIRQRELTPPELIRAILMAPVDLWFNGGIGTYVKATSESHADAADPANDAVRVNGQDLRAKVVAEGGNLGLTQRGRIEFALGGGRINTDFIDNSAGVDSSDREVNLKILLSDAIRRKLLARGRRDALLKAMTDEVAALVLGSNYAQTQVLSMLEARAVERIGEHARVVRTLEAKGSLKRALEFLPTEDEIDERRRQGKGFTRPELAIILSYAKIELFESLMSTGIPDDTHYHNDVVAYFPARLGKRFGRSIETHRLRREIAAMLVSSSMINRMGPYFALRARAETGASVDAVARAYSIVRSLFETRRLWREIEALDGAVNADAQYECFFECGRMLRRAVYWFLHRPELNKDIGQTCSRMQKRVAAVGAELPDILAGWSKRSFVSDVSRFNSLGMPAPISERIARLRLMTQILDIAELSDTTGMPPPFAGAMYFELGRQLKLDWIREQIEKLHVEGHWAAMARSTLRETLGREQTILMNKIFSKHGRQDYASSLKAWTDSRSTDIARLHQTLDEMQASGQMDFATLSIALKEIGRLL